MTRKEFIRRFITVHKCAGCNDILDYEYSDTAFCENCRIKWNYALNLGCSICFKPMRECECMPKRLRTSGSFVLRKLYGYQKQNLYLPEMNIIFIMKRKRYKRLVEFVAEYFISMIKEEIEAIDVDRDMLIITGVPRGQRSYRVYGFDQAQHLACKIGEKMGIKYEKMLYSKFLAQKQKTLNAKGRVSNANRSIRLCKNVSANGKYVILIDDIVTSGASMAACIKCLKRVGTLGVLCFSMASENKV